MKIRHNNNCPHLFWLICFQSGPGLFRLAGSLAGWLTDRLAHRLAGSQTGQLTDWLAHRQAGSETDWLNDMAGS